MVQGDLGPLVLEILSRPRSGEALRSGDVVEVEAVVELCRNAAGGVPESKLAFVLKLVGDSNIFISMKHFKINTSHFSTSLLAQPQFHSINLAHKHIV